MSRAKLIICSVLSVALLAGVIGMHRYRRNQELVRQRALKQAALVPVTLATVQEHPFRGTVAFTGTLLAVNRADLKAEESGRVTRVTVQEGDRVPAGAVLCAQEEEDLLLSVQAAEAQLAQAQVQAEQAGRDNERAQNLLAKRSVTKQAAQQAETAFNAALASVHAAESGLGLARSHLRKSRITAPFTGEVASRLVQPGEMLAPGQPAFCLVDNRRLEIQADLPAQALARIRPGLQAVLPGGGVRPAVPGHPHPDQRLGPAGRAHPAGAPGGAQPGRAPEERAVHRSYYIPCTLHEQRNLQPGTLLIDRALRDLEAGGADLELGKLAQSRFGSVCLQGEIQRRGGGLSCLRLVPARCRFVLRHIGREQLSAAFPYFLIYPYDRL